MRAQMDAGKLTEDAEKPKYMLDRLLRHKYNGSNELMPDLDIISEAMGHMLASAFFNLYLAPIYLGLLITGLQDQTRPPYLSRTSFGS